MKAKMLALLFVFLLAQGVSTAAAPAYGKACYCEASTKTVHCKVGKPTPMQKWTCKHIR